MIRRCDDGGSATAEFAVIVPAVVLLIALTAGSLSAVGRLVRLEQAVAQAARLAARGETGRVAELVAAIADARRGDRRGRRPRVRDGVRRPRRAASASRAERAPALSTADDDHDVGGRG
jgi:hypothetical protein